MGALSKKAHRIYHDARTVSLLPVAAIAADYTLTFLLAGSREEILRNEASPLLRFAVAQDLVLAAVVALMVFYYLASFLVLKMLSGSDLYPVGVALISLVSLTHLLGGISWYVRSPLYSDTVIGLSLISVMVAVLIFGYALYRGHRRTPG
jgi:hypothetical protein